MYFVTVTLALVDTQYCTGTVELQEWLNIDGIKTRKWFNISTLFVLLLQPPQQQRQQPRRVQTAAAAPVLEPEIAAAAAVSSSPRAAAALEVLCHVEPLDADRVVGRPPQTPVPAALRGHAQGKLTTENT